MSQNQQETNPNRWTPWPLLEVLVVSPRHLMKLYRDCRMHLLRCLGFSFRKAGPREKFEEVEGEVSVLFGLFFLVYKFCSNQAVSKILKSDVFL